MCFKLFHFYKILRVQRNIFFFILITNLSFSQNFNYSNVFGKYGITSNEQYNVKSDLILYKDFTFRLKSRTCQSMSNDTGYFTIKEDTIQFYLKLNLEKPNKSNLINAINKTNNFKLIFIEGKLCFEKIGNSDNSICRYKEGLSYELKSMLNKNGDGYARLLDKNEIVIEEGYYKNFNLYNGIKIKFDKLNDSIVSIMYNNGIISNY